MKPEISIIDFLATCSTTVPITLLGAKIIESIRTNLTENRITFKDIFYISLWITAFDILGNIVEGNLPLTNYLITDPGFILIGLCSGGIISIASYKFREFQSQQNTDYNQEQ